MENCNNHFDLDFSGAVVIREFIDNIKIGNVRAATYNEKPSVSARKNGEDVILDFVLPLPDGSLNVDRAMSVSSNNPVSNSVIKKYIDGKVSFTKIFSDDIGKTGYAYSGKLTDFDILICYASPSGLNSPLCYSIPISYCLEVKSPMELQVADNEAYTVFMFHPDGFYTEKYNGSAGGRVFGLYGVKI